MRSPATGIGFCKTEFHLPRGKTMVAHIRRFVLFRSICRRIIKMLTSGTHIYAVTGLETGSAPGPIGTGPGTKPVGTLCQPSIDIPNVNT